MSKRMKFFSVLVVMAVVLTAMNTSVMAEEEKPTCDASLGVFSQYIWRGYELSKDSVVLFPSITVGYKGFAFNVWGDLDTNFVGPTTDNGMELYETDYVLTYSNNFSLLNYTLGWIYYDVDNGEDQEVYVVLGLDTLLSPEVSVWRGIEHTGSWYIKLALSHSFELQNQWSFDVGAWASYYDIPDGGLDGGDYHAFHDGTVWVALNVPVNAWCTVTPSLNYSFALSNKSRDFLENANLAFADDDESNFLYGGITVSIAF